MLTERVPEHVFYAGVSAGVFCVGNKSRCGTGVRVRSAYLLSPSSECCGQPPGLVALVTQAVTRGNNISSLYDLYLD